MRRFLPGVSVRGVLLLVPLLVLVGTGVAWAGFTASVANPTSTISANTDITAPTVTAATGVRTASPQVVQHVTEGAAYQLYANVSDAGGPASGVSTVKADLSAITSGQTAASLTAGNAATVGGVSYGYGTASLTAGASLPVCRYAVPITAKDVAGNSSVYDQQVMVDRTLSTSGSLLRIDGPQGTSGVGWDQVPAGDVNGDGRSDWIVAAYTASPLGRASAGAAYVVFGRAGTATIDLANLGTGGYVIQGAAANDQAGYDVAALGDVNGDGRPDQLVTAAYADSNGSDAGSAYVVFGKSSTTAIDLGALGALGYRIDGAAAGDLLGSSARATGDLNADGRDDMMIGAPYADGAGRADSGVVYVLYGKATTSTIDLSAALGSSGYRIAGPVAGAHLGEDSVRAVGDLDGDGVPDQAVGSRTSSVSGRSNGGSVYVLRGKASPADVDLATLGSDGYRIDGAAAGDKLGGALGAAGDVNGDGIPDLALGASSATRNGRSTAGVVYVVWGSAGTATQDLASLGTGGFRYDGAVAGDRLGTSLAGIGDVDGDGVPDLLVGARTATEASGNGSGAVYVLFGSTTGGTTTDLAAYGAHGFRFEAAGIGGDMAGAEVADAGDVDGDGVHDLAIGAPGTDSNGNIDGGTAYVVRTPTCSYKQAVLQTSGLKSYWRLNATSGTVANDSKGPNGCGSYGPYTPGVAGALSDGDKAARFDDGSALWCNDVYDFAGITPFTVEAWIKVLTPALDGNFHRIVAKETWTGSYTEGWDLELSPAGGYPGIGGFANMVKVNRWHNSNGNSASTANNAVRTGRWYHVVMTTDASTTNIYVDGQLAASGATTNSIVDGTGGFQIGAGAASAVIDEVAIYDTALTQAQIQQHYALR